MHTVVKDNIAKLAVVVSLETNDKSENVKTFAKQLSMHIAASNPLALESSLIDQSIIDKEENALLSQAWVMEPKKKVKDVLRELSITDLKVKEFYRIKIGE